MHKDIRIEVNEINPFIGEVAIQEAKIILKDIINDSVKFTFEGFDESFNDGKIFVCFDLE